MFWSESEKVFIHEKLPWKISCFQLKFMAQQQQRQRKPNVTGEEPVLDIHLFGYFAH